MRDSAQLISVFLKLCSGKTVQESRLPPRVDFDFVDSITKFLSRPYASNADNPQDSSSTRTVYLCGLFGMRIPHKHRKALRVLTQKTRSRVSKSFACFADKRLRILDPDSATMLQSQHRRPPPSFESRLTGISPLTGAVPVSHFLVI